MSDDVDDSRAEVARRAYLVALERVAEAARRVQDEEYRLRDALVELDRVSVGRQGPHDGLEPWTLGEAGLVPYVTHHAAVSAAAAMGLEPEEARRELAEELLEARHTHLAVEGRPEKWRRRDRRWGWDATVRVSREGRLAVIIHASVRPYGTDGRRPRGGRPDRGRKNRQ